MFNIKKFLLPMAAILTTALLSASCSDNAAGASETVTSAESTLALGTSSDVQTEAASETASAAAAVSEAESTSESVSEAVTELTFEDTPQNAYERLTLSFKQSGDTVYPDDYGGTYSYGKTLFVAITEEEPTEYYTSLLSEYTCVRYRTVTHSMNELTAICEKAKELLDPDFGVYEVYIDVPSNMAAVSITKGDPKSAQQYLKSINDTGFTLDEVEIIMAETEESE